VKVAAVRGARLAVLAKLVVGVAVAGGALAGCGRVGLIDSCGSTNQACCPGSTCQSGLRCVAEACLAPGQVPIDLVYRTKADVLFLVDDSPSMEPMAKELRARFPQFFSVFSGLAATGFHADLHIGVVTSDLGAGATGAPGCSRGGGGKMGKLQGVGAAAPRTCLRPVGADYLQYVFAASGDGPSNLPAGQDLATTFACMASVGGRGCGFEHQLEAVYQQLHHPAPGFLRDDAILAVVLLTNEDDCSAPVDSDLFDESRTALYGFGDSYRCTRYGIVTGSPPRLPPYGASGGPLPMTAPAPNPGGAGPGKLFDVSRYIDFFTLPAAMGGAKANPVDVTLVGIDAPATPATVLLSDPGTPPGQPFVSCPQIDERGNPPCAPVLQHSCQSPTNASFFGDPSVRLNAVVQSVAHGSVRSICDDDYSGAMRDLGSQIAAQLGLGCIAAALPPDPAQPPGGFLADCTIKDVAEANGQQNAFAIPECTAPATTFPCWRVEHKDACAGRSPQGLGITIDRNGAPTPTNVNIKASCKTL